MAVEFDISEPSQEYSNAPLDHAQPHLPHLRQVTQTFVDTSVSFQINATCHG